MASTNTRKQKEITNLMKNGYKVKMINDSVDKFYVFFHGPPDSLYSEGVWKVRVELPKEYPSKSPFISFHYKIYHPNIQLMQVRLDLVMLFDHYLPQLLVEPNVEDPMNNEAADLFKSNKELYEEKVKDYVKRISKPKYMGAVPDVEPSVGPGDEAPAVAPGNESRAADPEDEETAAGNGLGDEAAAAGGVDP